MSLEEPPAKKICKVAEADLCLDKQLPDIIMAGDEDFNGHTPTKEKAAFEDLEYSSAMESDKAALSWVKGHELGDFYDNTFLPGEGEKVVVTNVSTGEVVVEIPTGDIQDVVDSAKDAKGPWNRMQAHIRARHLYSVTREIQKQGKLLAVMESISSGVSIRECKNVMLADLVETLYHFTGWAELSSSQTKGLQPHGIILTLLPQIGSLTQLARQVVPAIAAGNCVIICPAAPLPALLFATLCRTAGLPGGVVNVVMGSKARKALVASKNISMLSGCLSTQEECQDIVSELRYPIPVALSQVGRSAMVVFSNADIDSAVDCIADKAFFASGQTFDSIGRVLVQTSCYETLCMKLSAKVAKLRCGNGLDHSNDVGATLPGNAEAVKEILSLNTHLTQVKSTSPVGGTSSAAPTIVLDVQPSNELYSSGLLGPVVTVTQFRTAKEAVALVNHSKEGVGCSVWSEKNSLIMQLVQQLNVGTVWVNCHGIRDSAHSSQYRNCTGNVQTGGVDLLKSYMTYPLCPDSVPLRVDMEEVRRFGEEAGGAPLPPDERAVDPEESINRTVKLYIGGSLKRSSKDAYRTVYTSTGAVLGSYPDSSAKDVRDAVEAAARAQPGWAAKSGYNRSQILYFLAENICRRKEDFAELIAQSTGRKYDDGIQEVDTAIQRLFLSAATADKVLSSPWEHQDPVGVVGITAPPQWPMLGLCSLLGPALAAGNAVVVVPSDKYPLIAADLVAAIATSDIPGGVVNVLYGPHPPLSLALARHRAVNASWYFGTSEGCHVVQREGASNKKQVWAEVYDSRKWNLGAQGTGYSITKHCHCNKRVVMPPGDSFAN